MKKFYKIILMKTAIINSDSYEKHITGDGHPEQPKRVTAIKA